MKRSEVQDADLQRLSEVAGDIGSNVVLLTDVGGDTSVQVDGLVFPDIHAAIDHCEQVA